MMELEKNKSIGHPNLVFPQRTSTVQALFPISQQSTGTSLRLDEVVQNALRSLEQRDKVKGISNYLAALQFARSLKDIGANWDNEGGLQVDERAIDLAISFGERILKTCLTSRIIPEEPDVAPVNDGSVDLAWDTCKGNLLVNVKPTKVIVTHFIDGEEWKKAFDPEDSPRDVFVKIVEKIF